MTHSEIFKEIYSNHKRFIIVYVTICLIFSIFAFGNGNLVYASNGYNTTEVVTTLGGSFGQVFVPVVSGSLGSIDTSTAMLIMSAISFALDFIPESTLSSIGNIFGIEGLEGLSNYSFGILDYNFFRILFLLWFIVAKLSKSNRITYTTGLILEDFEMKIGAVVNGLVVATQFLANIPVEATVQASSGSTQPSNMVTYGFNALICFVLLISVFIIYLFIRYFFFFIDIVLLPICSVIPFSALGLESLKTLWVVTLTFMAIFQPYLFCIIFILMLIVSVLLFKRAYIEVRYFKNIYVKPFIKKLRGYNSEISLVSSKLPGKVKRYVTDINADIIIPVYLLRKIPDRKYTHKHQRWWFVSAGSMQYLCRPCPMKKTCYRIDLTNSIEKKIFIKKSLQYFEIFNLKGNEENIGQTFRRIHKNIHFVFSKEYYHRFQKIKELTLFTDYTEYKKQRKQNIKLSRKEEREQKRQERLEAKEEQRIAKHILRTR